MRVPNKLTGEGERRGRDEVREPGGFFAGRRRPAGAGAGQAARSTQQLANLITYMDGKSGAEELINKVLHDKNLLAALAADPQAGGRARQERVKP